MTILVMPAVTKFNLLDTSDVFDFEWHCSPLSMVAGKGVEPFVSEDPGL